MSEKEIEVNLKETLRFQNCPQCKEAFQLTWDDSVNSLIIRSCPSGGVYDVLIRCPHCKFEEGL